MNRGKGKRRLSLLLCTALLFTLLGTTTYATESKDNPGGLCEHHTEHTAECGYAEETPGEPCRHKHTDDCYNMDKLICEVKDVPIASDNNMAHQHTLDCYELDCPHERGEHDDTCGYVEAVPGSPCTNSCELCDFKKDSGTSPVTSGQNVQKTECDCTEACTADSINPACPVCGANGAELADCKGAAESTLSDAETITEWEWLNPDAGLVHGRFSISDVSPDKQLSFDALIKRLPNSIAAAVEGEADTRKVALVWTCGTYTQNLSGNWPVQGEYFFTATLSEDYILAGDAEPLEIRVTLGVANEVPNYDGLAITGGTVVKGTDGQIKLTEDNADYSISGSWKGNITGVTEANLKAVITVSDGVAADVELNGVTIDVSSNDGVGAFALEGAAEAHVTLSGTNTLKSGSSCAGLAVPENASLTITGMDSDKLIANGGRLFGAGIGGSYSQSGGTITISGGNVETKGGAAAAGIGSGFYRVSGSGSGGTITISGGNVKAQGGSNGAGIGGGGSGGTITISGGKVEAQGDGYGAGIGGGVGGSSGIILISGGSVKARGIYFSPGIGGGGAEAGISTGGGSVDTITINGGSVEAYGSENSVDIGGGGSEFGSPGDNGTIRINGGVVKANTVGGQPTDSGENRVYVGKLAEQSGVTGVSVDNVPYYVDANYSDDNTLYLYMPHKDTSDDSHVVDVYTSAGNASYTATWVPDSETFSFGAGAPLPPGTNTSVLFEKDAYSGTYGETVEVKVTVYDSKLNGRAASNAVPNSVSLLVDGESVDKKPVLVSGRANSFEIDLATLSAGSHTLKAEYGGSHGGKGSASEAITLTVKMSPTVIWPTGLEITYGQALNDINLTGKGSATGAGGAEVTGDFAWGNGDTKPNVSDSDKTGYIMTFTPSVESAELYNGDTKYDVTVTVHRVAGTLVISCANAEYGTAVFPTVINNTSGGAVTYLYEGIDGTHYAASAASPRNAGKYTVTGTAAANADYNETKSVPVEFEITKAPQPKPAAPILNAVTATEITINTMIGQNYILTENTTPPATTSGTWIMATESATLEFDSLTSGKDYYCWTYAPGSNNLEDSPLSEASAVMSTLKSDAQSVAAAKTAIEGGSGWTVAQATANTEDTVKDELVKRMNGLPGVKDNGITVSADNITISGVHEATAGTASDNNGADGSFSFTVALSKGSANATTTSRSGAITATPYKGTPAVITTASLPNGTVGTAYSATLTTTGDEPITWSIAHGDLPGGLTLHNGTISGTPTAANRFEFTVQAANGISPDSQKELMIAIANKDSGGNPGSGDGGSGNSGSGSRDSGSTTTINPSKPPAPDSPTTGEIIIDAPGKDGIITITGSQVESAIDKAMKDAAKDGRKANGVAVSINLPNGTVSLCLECAALDRLISSGVKSFKMDFGGVSMTFDLATLKEIQKQSGGAVTFTAAKATDLTGDALAAVGTRPAYDLKISCQKDGQTVNLSSVGRVPVAIDYTPAENEKDGTLYAVYADGEKAVWLDKSSYNKNSKALLLMAEHFSVYGVGYKAPPTFTDTVNHWAESDIDFVASRGLLAGTSETAFTPDGSMTRGMFVTALGRLAGIDTAAYASSNRFTDVAAGAYYAPYVEWAASKDIVTGTGEKTFAPDQNITREQMAAIMQQYADKIGYVLPLANEAEIFADEAQISTSFKSAVQAIQQAGIMNGKNGRLFAPKDTATRAETSVVLRRFVEVVIDSTVIGWIQNDSGA